MFIEHTNYIISNWQLKSDYILGTTLYFYIPVTKSNIFIREKPYIDTEPIVKAFIGVKPKLYIESTYTDKDREIYIKQADCKDRNHTKLYSRVY